MVGMALGCATAFTKTIDHGPFASGPPSTYPTHNRIITMAKHGGTKLTGTRDARSCQREKVGKTHRSEFRNSSHGWKYRCDHDYHGLATEAFDKDHQSEIR